MTVSTESLRTLAGWAPAFTRIGTPWHRYEGEADESGVITMPYYSYSEEINRFVAEMYDAQLVEALDWPSWTATARARDLIEDTAKIAEASADELMSLVTTIIRGERFCDGQIAAAIDHGSLLAIAKRAEVLVMESEGEPKSKSGRDD